MAFHLMRAKYRTDAGPAGPTAEYPGLYSGTIPDRMFEDGAKIVAVDWETEPAYVWVTFLCRGKGAT